MKNTPLKFSHRTFQGSYVFTYWLGMTHRTLQVFADGKREARGMAEGMRKREVEVEQPIIARSNVLKRRSIREDIFYETTCSNQQNK